MTPEEKRIAIAEACQFDRKMNYFVNGKTVTSLSTDLPDYLNDANAALEFANQLASEGWSAEAGMGTDGTWECTFYKPASKQTHADNKGEREAVVTEEHYGAGGTLALAICEAGLRTKGLWKE